MNILSSQLTLLDAEVVKRLDLGANVVANSLSKMPQHLKKKSRSGLFDAIKTLGAQCSEFCKSAEEAVNSIDLTTEIPLLKVESRAFFFCNPVEKTAKISDAEGRKSNVYEFSGEREQEFSS